MSLAFSIVIVNYNLTHEIKNCINSILVNEKSNNYEIIVVDNASTDGGFNNLYKDFPISAFPPISFYYLNENRGFGAGNNYGVSKARGEIIFLLNPDALLIGEIFNSVETFFRNQSGIGALGPKIVDNQNQQEKSFGFYPSVLLEFLDIFLLRRKFELKVLLRKISNGEKEVNEVNWVTGSAMFIPKKIYQEVLGFDEKFFLYNEEVDLCFRIKQLGYKISFSPSILIKHLGSVGSKKNYYLFTKYSYESKLIYIKKHFSFPKIFFIRMFIASQIIVQIAIWSILIFPFRAKAKGKLKAFPSILFKTLTNQ
jgi:GT2 family glycosyltransferase